MTKISKFRIDGYLEQNLNIVLDVAIPHKWDMMGILTGTEGAGKSTHGSQVAIKLWAKHNLDYCVFTPQQFIEIIDTCPEEASILWDEAITGTNVAQHASEMQITIISRLVQIRKKKLKLLLCAPYLHMFNKYFIGRCLFGIHVYAKNFDDRGYALFYSQKRLELVYNYMKERFRYNPLKALSAVRSNFHYKFNAYFPYDVDKYDTKKETSRIENQSKDKIQAKDRVGKLIKHLVDNNIMTQREIGVIFEVSQAHISRMMA